MKKVLFSSIFMAAASAVSAQAVLDTVYMGPQYANNVWYLLDGDEAGAQPANNWEIALAATNSQTSSLTTALHINPKVVKLYEAAGVTIADFATVTAFDNNWTELNNTDTLWSVGAFNTTSPMSQFDYGWGTYNTTTHSVEANRVFVLEYTGTSTYRKMHVTLNTMAGTYTLVHSNLDNSDLHTETLNIAPYSTKNFMYFTLTGNAVVDREPETNDWDLVFTQYTAYIPSPYTVTGILHNEHVEVLKVSEIANVTTYQNWISPDYSPYINSIGYNWKAYTGGQYVIEDSTVYFVKAMNGDIWKMIMTGFGGSADGGFMFSKEKMATASVENTAGANEAGMTIYPNPAAGSDVKVIYNIAKDSKHAQVLVYDVAGRTVLSKALESGKGLHQYQLPVSGLSPGAYIVNLSTESGTMQQRLIIQ